MNPIIIIVFVSAVVAGISFFSGMKYQQSKTPVLGSSRFALNGQRGMGGNTRGFRPVSGEVLSTDEKSMTVKLPDGSTKIILLSDSTTYSKSNSGSKSDVQSGQTVTVFGTENSDGSVTAQNVQLNPEMRGLNGSNQASPSAVPVNNY